VLPAPARADVGVNLYGLSHHFDRARARELKVDNGVNPGLGLRYRIAHSERLEWIFDVGAYRDSGRNVHPGKNGHRAAARSGLRAWQSDAQRRLPPQGLGDKRGGYAGLLGDLVAALSAA
jgi:hypothetical protein